MRFSQNEMCIPNASQNQIWMQSNQFEDKSLTADRLWPVVVEADGTRRGRRGNRVVVLLDGVDGFDESAALGRQGCVEACKEVLAGDEAQVGAARGRDGDGRGNLGRHGESWVRDRVVG